MNEIKFEVISEAASTNGYIFACQTVACHIYHSNHHIMEWESQEGMLEVKL